MFSGFRLDALLKVLVVCLGLVFVVEVFWWVWLSFDCVDCCVWFVFLDFYWFLLSLWGCCNTDLLVVRCLLGCAGVMCS